MANIGLSELILMGIVVLLILAAWRSGAARRKENGPAIEAKQSFSSSRFLVFVLGALQTIVEVVAFSAGGEFSGDVLSAPILAAAAQSGLIWVLTYEVVRLFRPRLRRPVIPLYIAAIWYLQRPVFLVVSFAWRALVDGQSLDRLWETLGSSSYWLHLPTTFSGVVDAGTTALLCLVVYRLVASRAPGGFEGPLWLSAGSGYGGIPMAPGTSHTTRYLCASAVLSGAAFRARILERFRDKQRAPSPEPGVDMQLVVQVCKAMDKRERKFETAFLVTGVLILAVAPLSFFFVPLVLAFAGIYFDKRRDERFRLGPLFREGVFDPDTIREKFPSTLSADVIRALPRDDQNVVVYQGFSPFVGAGERLGGWSFTIDVKKPKELATADMVEAVTADELYAALDDALRALGLSDLDVRDYLFVSGADIRNNRDILSDALARPNETVDSEVVKRYVTAADRHVRHYKWVRIHDWGSELVLSYFVRFTLTGPTLFVEINRSLLTPLSEECRSIDAIPPRHFRHLAALGAESLIIGPIMGTLMAVRVAGRALGTINEMSDDERRRREIEDNPLFDYGVRKSVRESFATNQFVHYFQKTDSDFYAKVLDRKILDAICVFLDARNIDTSDLRERQTMILNSGIIVQSGDVRAESLAVGAGAQAVKTERAMPGRRVHVQAAGR